jgi:hypothetical protein
VLDAMAAKVHDPGAEVGPGAAFKMINQLLSGMHIAAAGEAIAFAEWVRRYYRVDNNLCFPTRRPPTKTHKRERSHGCVHGQ